MPQRIVPSALGQASYPKRTGPADHPWTGARCLRVLRQLESRLASLRRLTTAQRLSQDMSLKRSVAEQDDLQNVGPARKRVKRTYDQRRRKPTTSQKHKEQLQTPQRIVRPLGSLRANVFSPGADALAFSSPLCQEIRQESIRSTSQQNFALRTTQSHGGQCDSDSRPWKGSRQLLQDLRHTVSETEYRIYEFILSWLQSLLQSTRPSAQPSIQKKSLLAMCLRKVPSCIAELETWDSQVSDQASAPAAWRPPNVAVDIYGQLEAFGSAEEGWRPLKVVIRSHAIEALSKATREGLFEPAFVLPLAQACSDHSCEEEAARLTALVLFPDQLSRSIETQRSGTIRAPSPMPRAFTGTTSSRIRPFLHQISSAWTKDGQCLDLVTSPRSSHIWIAALASATTADSADSTTAFLATALFHLAAQCGRGVHKGADTIEGILIKALATITASIIALQTQRRAGYDQEQSRRIHRRLIHVLDTSMTELSARTRPRRGQSNGAYILAVARYMAVSTSIVGPQAHIDLGIDVSCRLRWRTEMKGLVPERESIAQVQERQTSLLVSSIVRYHCRTFHVPIADAFEPICARLDEFQTSTCSGQKLRRDAALLIADKTKSLRDFAFAESLPLSGVDSMPGWQWEESIGEWVVTESVNNYTSARLSRAGRDGETSDYLTSQQARRKGYGRLLSLATKQRVSYGSDQSRKSSKLATRASGHDFNGQLQQHMKSRTCDGISSTVQDSLVGDGSYPTSDSGPDEEVSTDEEDHSAITIEDSDADELDGHLPVMSSRRARSLDSDGYMEVGGSLAVETLKKKKSTQVTHPMVYSDDVDELQMEM